MVQQQGDDLLDPEVLNNLTKLGQEGKYRTVGVDWVIHDVLALCLCRGII